MLMEITGNHPIPGPVNRNGMTNAHEMDDVSLSFDAPDEGHNDGRPRCGQVTLRKIGTAGNHDFLRWLLARNAIGTVTLVRHRAVNNQVVRDLEVTLTNAVVTSFSPCFSEAESGAAVTLSFETIRFETFTPEGRSAGSVTYDRSNNKIS